MKKTPSFLLCASLLFLGWAAILLVGWTATYDTTTPAGTDSPSIIDDRIREVKLGVQERQNVDHYWPLSGSQVSDADAGKHRKVTFQEVLATKPTLTSGQLAVYTKLTDSNEAIWLESDAGTERQLTTGSGLYLKMVDADGAVLKTGNQTVAGVKLFTDIPETDANAVDANDLTRKAYVDHEIDDGVDEAVAEAIADPNLHFGTWTTKDSENNNLAENTVYQATGEGFVLGNTSYTDSTVYTDSSNPPTISRWYSTGAGWRGFCVPVKKNDYWKATGVTGTIHWLPIGGGECEKQP